MRRPGAQCGRARRERGARRDRDPGAAHRLDPDLGGIAGTRLEPGAESVTCTETLTLSRPMPASSAALRTPFGTLSVNLCDSSPAVPLNLAIFRPRRLSLRAVLKLSSSLPLTSHGGAPQLTVSLNLPFLPFFGIFDRRPAFTVHRSLRRAGAAAEVLDRDASAVKSPARSIGEVGRRAVGGPVDRAVAVEVPVVAGDLRVRRR